MTVRLTTLCDLYSENSFFLDFFANRGIYDVSLTNLVYYSYSQMDFKNMTALRYS